MAGNMKLNNLTEARTKKKQEKLQQPKKTTGPSQNTSSLIQTTKRKPKASEKGSIFFEFTNEKLFKQIVDKKKTSGTSTTNNKTALNK